MRPLLERIQKGEIDPSFVITHRLSLDAAPDGYKMFRDKEDDCIKVVMRPLAGTASEFLAIIQLGVFHPSRALKDAMNVDFQ